MHVGATLKNPSDHSSYPRRATQGERSVPMEHFKILPLRDVGNKSPGNTNRDKSFRL